MGDAGVVQRLPASRAFLLDERGVGLRATWHLDRGIANLSIWRGDRCTETFHLSMADAAGLIAFLADGLAERAAGEASRDADAS